VGTATWLVDVASSSDHRPPGASMGPGSPVPTVGLASAELPIHCAV